MVFLLFFLIILLIFITIKIKFEFINFKFSTIDEDHINKDYKIKIILYTFYKIPILKKEIDNEKIQKLLSNEKLAKVIKNQEIKIIQNRKDIDINIFKVLKNINIEIDEINLNIKIGTEDASITAFMIPIISTILSIILSKNIKKYNDKQIFSINPIYINQNFINIYFSGIFNINMIHIINTICMLNRKRKGDKNERTSNRRSYDYGYE